MRNGKDHPLYVSPFSPPSTLSELTVLRRSDVNQDEEVLRNQMLEQEAARRREAEAREREAELARRRLEEERLAREEEERRQAERGKALEKRGVGRGVSRTVGSSSSGVRGVRGTRASMRARGVATGIARGRIDSSFNSGDGPHVLLEGTTTSGPGKTDVPRPSSSASARTSTIPSRGRGRT